jgi:catechol 2,3-dioxygenase-like lactoylglutathione lyase family enzyme
VVLLSVDQQITFLYTRNLSNTARFYEDKLGLRLALDQGNCRIYQVSGDAYLGFCQRETTPEQPQGVILTLVTDDVDEWYEHLLGLGVTFEKAPAHNRVYGIYHCFLRDPNGYLVEIQRFDDPDWATVIDDEIES